MIELLKEFLLFGVIEIFILMMFCKYIGNISSIKWRHGIFICILGFIFGITNIPFVKEIGLILIVIIYLYLLTKNIYLKISIYSFLYMLITEVIFSIIFSIILGNDFNFSLLDIKTKFLLFIPIRISEITLIIIYYKGKENMGWFLFGQVKKKKKKAKQK